MQKRRPKTRVPLQTTWHQDVVPYPMPVCVISSRAADGNLNVASCSSVFPWSVSPEIPQMVVVTRASSHTSTNIRATKEFCLNFMPTSSLKDVVATGRPAESGRQKHELLGLKLEDARDISVPRLADATWVIECTLVETVYPSERQLLKSTSGSPHRAAVIELDELVRRVLGQGMVVDLIDDDPLRHGDAVRRTRGGICGQLETVPAVGDPRFRALGERGLECTSVDHTVPVNVHERDEDTIPTGRAIDRKVESRIRVNNRLPAKPRHHEALGKDRLHEVLAIVRQVESGEIHVDVRGVVEFNPTRSSRVEERFVESQSAQSDGQLGPVFEIRSARRPANLSAVGPTFRVIDASEQVAQRERMTGPSAAAGQGLRSL